MDVVDQKTRQELMQSLVPELAKASNELRCAERDLAKARARLGFLVMVVNRLIDRETHEDNRPSTPTPTD
jgi:hypothetical protein